MKNKDKDINSYDKWRYSKISEIRLVLDCTQTEATIIFLLQDIAYKLSKHYEDK